jgi:hypothetical protein
VEQKKKKRFFRIEKSKFRKESTLIKLDNLYPEYFFAKTKFNDIHIIFEVSSGYIVGQGKTYTNARNAAKKYLNFTSGKFSIIVDSYQLDGKE